MPTSTDLYLTENQRPFRDVFASPGSVLRGAPFWSWNNRLDRDQLFRQIDMFQKMGIGGYTIHSRTGLATEYLGDEFMDIVEACVAYGKERDMLTWLYDEDRWPSGSAGGRVTKNPQYHSRYLLWTQTPYGAATLHRKEVDSRANGGRNEKGRLLAAYAVTLTPEGHLASYRREDPSRDDPHLWYAYLETSEPAPWFNHQPYVDTLNPAAIRQFVETTHERYASRVGHEFGHSIRAIFTDEPQFTSKGSLLHARDACDLVLPWTDDLSDSFQEAYGEDLLAVLPEVIWELPDRKASVARYRYHDHVAERFAAAFADVIGTWCEAHNIALTGHMMEEPTLASQTQALGEAMRSYRSFQIPGIDILCDRREYTTAKQAQSASHQYGRNAVLSELYGVTDWDYDFAGHKSQGDWQAALGVTVRVHHLSMVSMQGESKRDYPSSISYQSPWWEAYAMVEDHFARVNAALVRGRPVVRIGVIHPIESFWLCWGPKDQTQLEQDDREYTFKQITEWLLFGQLDFDFICESLLPELCPDGAATDGQGFRVGAMTYDLLLLPPMRTLRSTTVDRLSAFMESGGQVLFVGETPSLVDARPSNRVELLARRTQPILCSQARLVDALSDVRDICVRTVEGPLYSHVLYQLRADGAKRYLFICDTRRRKEAGIIGIDEDGGKACQVRIRGIWSATMLDTFTGDRQPLPVRCTSGWTEFEWTFWPHGHLLLELHPGTETLPDPVSSPMNETRAAKPQHHLSASFPVTLSEPNALLLDQARWRLNGGAWQEREELLRLHNLARAQCGLEPQHGMIAQPWADPEAPRSQGILELSFQIHSGVTLSGLKLALEEAHSTQVFLDDVPVHQPVDGWWVDESIQTLPFPTLEEGSHELRLRIAYTDKTSLEWCYLLGDFGVSLKGRQAELVAPVRELAWGDITRQGLPFYTGNITYHCRFRNPLSGPLALRIPKFSGAMVAVRLDGKERPGVAFSPFQSDLGTLSPGEEYSLDLTLYGNRFNAFGAVHSAIRQPWPGPAAWRLTGDDWCYEYALRPLGILTAPRLV